MRRRFASIVTLLLAAFALQAHAYSNIYVFGDSLSDDGNNAVLLPSFGISQTVAPYNADAPAPQVPIGSYAGTNNYSNGPVWTDYLATALGLPLAPSMLGGNNFAFGGARTGAIGTSDDNDPRPPSLRAQAELAVTRDGTLPSDALYTVWGGSNDLRALASEFGPGLGSLDPNVQAQSANSLAAGINASIANLAITLQTLAAAGARDFLILNIPDLGLTPSARFVENLLPGTRDLMSGLALTLNQSITAMVAAASSTPGFSFTLFDVFTFNHVAVDNPAPGANVTEACTAQNAFAGCGDPQNYLYWDGIHPTTAAHLAIAASTLNALQPAPVPVPASLPLAAAGMVMLAGMARRRRAA